MTDRERYNLLRRVYRALRMQNVQVKIDRGIDPFYGTCEVTDANSIITINPLKTRDFWLTLIHECLHLVNYDDHDWVRQKERELYESMSDVQLTNLLAKAIMWLR